MSETGGVRLRTGRKVGRTLYLTGDQPGDGDVLAGHARTEKHARAVCDAVNDGVSPGARWWCAGGLILDHPSAHLTREWIAALDDPEVARRVVAAARGEEGPHDG